MKHKRFFQNAAVISLGGIIAKAIGALYRIPLTNLLGSYGTGLYQMAYPLFLVLLTFSSAGVSSALSRIVARERVRGEESRSTVITAAILFSLLGLFGTALMCLVAPYVASLQGENLQRCYYMLAPSVFLVALISVFRGYFQGRSNMKPTAISEVTEQIIKSLAGLYFTVRFRGEPVRAVSYALFAVTLSEAGALLYLALRFRYERFPRRLRVKKASAAELFACVLPVMLSASLFPLSQMADSVFVVRLLGARERAVSLYGLFTGGAISLISLPATACAGIATAIVPSVSACFARGREEEGKSRALFALAVTLACSIPCALVLFFFSSRAVSLLFPALTLADAQMLSRLLKLLSVSAVTLAGVDTLSACLTGMGRAGRSAFAMLVAVLVKTALQFILIKRLSVFGGAVAFNACYLVAFFLDLFYTVRKKREKKHDYGYRSRNGARRFNGEGAYRAQKRGSGAYKKHVARFGGASR